MVSAASAATGASEVPAADDRDRAVGRGQRAEGHRAGDQVDLGVGQRLADDVERLGGEAGREDRALGVLVVERPEDGDHLVGCLAGAVDDFGVAGARRAVDVHARETEVGDPGVLLFHGPEPTGHPEDRCHCRCSGVGCGVGSHRAQGST